MSDTSDPGLSAPVVSENPAENPAPIKRGRGRPRKPPPEQPVIKRKRGRPVKYLDGIIDMSEIPLTDEDHAHLGPSQRAAIRFERRLRMIGLQKLFIVVPSRDVEKLHAFCDELMSAWKAEFQVSPETADLFDDLGHLIELPV